MAKHFTDDVLQSGLAYRFLMCQGDFKPFTENVDYFDRTKKEMCQPWQELIKGLFNKGARLGRTNRL